jgi:hypothetical protein
MVAPDADAGAVRETVQVELAGGVTDTGKHTKPFKLGSCRIVTIDPMPDNGNDAPAVFAPETFASWTTDVVLLVDGDNTIDTVATTPFEIAEVLRPHRTQVELPGPLLQEIDLFAPLAAGPTAQLADEKSVAEYARVHSIAAGGTLVALNERFRVTMAPVDAEAEERVRLPDWAKQPHENIKRIIE